MDTNTRMALVLSRVTVRFDDVARGAIPVLSDITFAIPTGGFVSITGPSGSGKSTLMRIILGLMPLDSGTIVRNFAKSAMVFQNYALFPWLTALENVAFGLKMAGLSRKEREHIARTKLVEVGLKGFEAHYPVALSGGQRQRVGLARALAIEPDFLVMDEPFSNLDTITAEALKADLMKIWRTYGITILMVNHLIPDAVELSDHIIVMSAHPGRIHKVMPIELPRPRDTRGPQFFAHVDALTELIRKVS